MPSPDHPHEPFVISASRATDIPAFHMPWFMRRLRAGHCVRINPFNAGQRLRISFARCRVIVFWSKDPRPLLAHLPEILGRGHEFYIQYTLNDYEGTGLEPHVPPLAVRLETLRRLCGTYGPDRLVWRFDPLLVRDDMPPEALLERLDRLGRLICPYVDEAVFSFLSLYARVGARLRRLPFSPRPPDAGQKSVLAAGLAAASAAWAHPLRLAACAEKEDLGAWGVARSACIDPERIRRLCPREPLPAELSGRDPHQRPQCRCAPSKDIGAYNTCRHLCAYCYANHSGRAVINALRALDVEGEAMGRVW
jgi:hypothetical protein